MAPLTQNSIYPDPFSWNRTSRWRFAALSLLFHLVLFFLTPARFTALYPRVEKQPIRVVLRPEAKERKVVDVSTPEATEAVVDADYLAERNTRVEKETVAVVQSTTPGGAPQKSTPTPHRDPPRQKEVFSLETMTDDERDPMRDQLSLNPGSPGDREILKDVHNPSDRTEVNALEFMFAGYYNRIKRKVRNVWSPIPTLRNEDLSRQDEVAVIVSFSLNSDGTLDEVAVKRSSGISRFDHEAVRALKKATPFPNPPSGLIRPDGKVHIPEWGFIVFKSRWVYGVY